MTIAGNTFCRFKKLNREKRYHAPVDRLSIISSPTLSEIFSYFKSIKRKQFLFLPTDYRINNISNFCLLKYFVFENIIAKQETYIQVVM